MLKASNEHFSHSKMAHDCKDSNSDDLDCEHHQFRESSRPTLYSLEQCSKSFRPTLFSSDDTSTSEAIRLCFVIGKIEFKDVRLSKEAFQVQNKTETNDKGLPCLEVNGQKYSGLRAILLYAAECASLLPSSFEDRLKGAAMLDVAYNMIESFDDVLEKDATNSTFCQYLVESGKLSDFDVMVAKDQGAHGHILGKQKITYIDVFVATLIHMLQDCPVHNDFPALTKVHELVYQLESVKRWTLKHPTTVKLAYRVSCPTTQIVELAMSVAGVQYEKLAQEEEVVTHEQSPTIILDGVKHIIGIYSILEWINAKYPIIPIQEESALRSRSIFSLVCDLWDKLMMKHKDEAFVLSNVQKELDNIERTVMSQQSLEVYSVGDKLSIADISIAGLIQYVASNSHIKVNFTCMRALMKSCILINGLDNVKKAALNKFKAEVYHFNIPSEAESLCWLLTITGVEFRDFRFDQETWLSTYKSKSPTGQCPFVKLGSQTFTEILAMLKYFAGLTSTEPLTNHGRLVADSIGSILQRFLIVSASSHSLKGEEAVNFLKAELRPITTMIENSLMSHGCEESVYIVENRLTWIDIFLAATMDCWSTWRQIVDLKNYPITHRIFESVSSLPVIVNYKEKNRSITSKMH